MNSNRTRAGIPGETSWNRAWSRSVLQCGTGGNSCGDTKRIPLSSPWFSASSLREFVHFSTVNGSNTGQESTPRHSRTCCTGRIHLAEMTEPAQSRSNRRDRNCVLETGLAKCCTAGTRHRVPLYPMGKVHRPAPRVPRVPTRPRKAGVRQPILQIRTRHSRKHVRRDVAGSTHLRIQGRSPCSSGHLRPGTTTQRPSPSFRPSFCEHSQRKRTTSRIVRPRSCTKSRRRTRQTSGL